MLRPMNCVQTKTRFIPAVIVGASGTPSIGEGDKHLSVADTATGIYTITITQAFARAPVICATPVIASTGVELFAVLRTVAADSFIVEVTDEAGLLTDADVHLLIWGSDSADEV